MASGLTSRTRAHDACQSRRRGECADEMFERQGTKHFDRIVPRDVIEHCTLCCGRRSLYTSVVIASKLFGGTASVQYSFPSPTTQPRRASVSICMQLFAFSAPAESRGKRDTRTAGRAAHRLDRTRRLQNRPICSYFAMNGK